jgi:hypothetical protein
VLEEYGCNDNPFRASIYAKGKPVWQAFFTTPGVAARARAAQAAYCGLNIYRNFDWDEKCFLLCGSSAHTLKANKCCPILPPGAEGQRVYSTMFALRSRYLTHRQTDSLRHNALVGDFADVEPFRFNTWPEWVTWFWGKMEGQPAFPLLAAQFCPHSGMQIWLGGIPDHIFAGASEPQKDLLTLLHTASCDRRNNTTGHVLYDEAGDELLDLTSLFFNTVVHQSMSIYDTYVSMVGWCAAKRDAGLEWVPASKRQPPAVSRADRRTTIAGILDFAAVCLLRHSACSPDCPACRGAISLYRRSVGA